MPVPKTRVANLQDSSIVEALSAQFRAEIKELHEMQNAAEKRRQQERKEEEEKRKKESTEIAVKQQELLEMLLQSQVDESQEKVKRDKLLVRVLGALLLLITSSGGTAGYLVMDRSETDAENTREVKKAIKRVEAGSSVVEHRITTAERKIERLGHVAVSQQMQLIESVDFILRRIDAAHPRSAGKVERPQSLKPDLVKAKLKQMEEVFFDENTPRLGEQ